MSDMEIKPLSEIPTSCGLKSRIQDDLKEMTDINEQLRAGYTRCLKILKEADKMAVLLNSCALNCDCVKAYLAIRSTIPKQEANHEED